MTQKGVGATPDLPCRVSSPTQHHTPRRVQLQTKSNLRATAFSSAGS